MKAFFAVCLFACVALAYSCEDPKGCSDHWCCDHPGNNAIDREPYVDCSHYCACQGGPGHWIVHVMPCPEDLAYHEGWDRCTYPKYVPGCDGGCPCAKDSKDCNC